MASGQKKPDESRQPIGDPPARKQPVRADQGARNKKSAAPMMDPFTEQSTHPAGEGQGANAPPRKQADRTQTANDGGDEETMPIEEGFSPVP